MSNREVVLYLNDVEFGVYAPTTRFAAKPGVYVFAYEEREGEWVPLYVGQTGSFRTRLASHEEWSEAAQRGATHIHAKVVRDSAARSDLERRLIHAYDPPLND